MGRFDEGSAEIEEIKRMQKAFEDEFGGQNTSSDRAGDVRASGVCDYSVDEGLRPVDISRAADLPVTPLADLAADRPGLG